MIPVSAHAPAPEAIGRAAAVLRAGGLVAFPTETVYGLGANALDPAAVARIFTAKGRPANNPLIVHLPTADSVQQVAESWPETAQRLAARFWPGPLTLVLPRRARLPATVTGGGPTVAVRVPAHPVALALLRAADLPVAAPSANRSEQVSPTCAEHVLRSLGGRIDLILDGGPAWGGLESTVLDVTCTPPRLLRPGLVAPNEIEAVIGPIARAATADVPAGAALASPGMQRRHYAPRAPLECCDGTEVQRRLEALQQERSVIGWLPLRQPAASLPARIVVVPMPAEPAAYAAQLYAVLHRLDAAGVERILVELPPDTQEWLAIRDRLRRASAEG